MNQILMMNKASQSLSVLIRKKYISMFGEIPVTEIAQFTQISDDLASRFSWNLPRAKANLEVLTRQVWMRLKSKDED
jgi:hypothetical protein